MRIRYCKILQSIKIDDEEDAWLTPLEDISVVTKPSRPLALTRIQQIKKYFGMIWQLLHPSTPGPSYEWLVLESVRPQTITTRMKSYFRKINSSKNNKDDETAQLDDWLDILVNWMNDSEETVSVDFIMYFNCRQKPY